MSDAQQAADLAAWLETTREPAGYGGPVVHWWQNCLSYTGAGLDWRYEGIITGYLALHERTGEPKWLERARKAGDDLLRGQLPSGNFRNSNFEQNPYAGGTPHEAAADLALLRLATALRAFGEHNWERYALAAEANLRYYWLTRLWDAGMRTFRNAPNSPLIVPNKVCTVVEALFAWAQLRSIAEPIEFYALAALQGVVDVQIKTPDYLAGAIPQSTNHGVAADDYFPYYIARCIPALLLAYDFTGEERWAAASLSAGSFIVRHVGADGLLPQVLYKRKSNRYPQWISALGDVLRALDLLRSYNFGPDTSAMEATLRAGQMPSGGIFTARGFGAQIDQRFDSAAPPDFRDSFPVAGWIDKSFAWLAKRVPEGQQLPPPRTTEATFECLVRGTRTQFRETATEVVLKTGARTLYEWRKGEPWARIVAPEVMWK